jgi:hypothetical protein
LRLGRLFVTDRSLIRLDALQNHFQRRLQRSSLILARLDWIKPFNLSQLRDQIGHAAHAATFDQFHGIMMNSAVAPYTVHLHDIGMVQSGYCLDLNLKALNLPGVHRASRRQHLESHASAQRRLVGLVHNPHPATADLAQQAKVTEDFCGRFIQIRFTHADIQVFEPPKTRNDTEMITARPTSC